MAYDLPINQWVPMSNFRPNGGHDVAPSIARKFWFHHIRIASSGAEVFERGTKDAATFRLQKFQVSLILGQTGDRFDCATITSAHVNNQALLLANDYATYDKLGQAKLWQLAVGNLFRGPYEVFNGPNRIDLASV